VIVVVAFIGAKDPSVDGVFILVGEGGLSRSVGPIYDQLTLRDIARWHADDTLPD
jgi:hypothetical protein